jgi:hypothetical protein
MPFFYCLALVVMGGEKETERWGGYTMMRNAYVYVCVRVDRLYFLSIYDDDEDAENARATVAGLLRIDPFLSPVLPSFLPNVESFFARHHRTQKFR